MRIQIHLFYLSLLFIYGQTAGQTKSIKPRWNSDTIVRALTSAEVMDKFGDTSKNIFTKMPIYRAYEYGDEGGMWNILLGENRLSVNGKDTINNRIKAICFLQDHGVYTVKWEINDQLETPKPSSDLPREQHIWFWTRYCRFNDIDGDGYKDPIIVYGTSSPDVGKQRVRIITLYKGKKYAVRALECDLDYCRTLQYDPSVKTLPASIRKAIENLMQELRNDQGLILQNG